MTAFCFFSYVLPYVTARVVGNDHFSGFGPGNGDPNDEFYPEQKAYLEAISVPEAWSILATAPKRTPVTIAVIDDGIEADHPDLKGRVIEGYNVIDKNTDTHPRGPHGTMMTGILGAITNNKIGIAGVVDGVRVLPIFTGEKAEGATDLDAFQYLIDERKDVKVILYTATYKLAYPPLLRKILEAVIAGMLVVVSAGNNHVDMDVTKEFPCTLSGQHRDGVICVAATNDTKMQLDDESNFGSTVDIATPGYRLLATSTGGTYKLVTGTSAAAAIAAGVAGMLYSLEPSQKAELTPNYIKTIIKETATPGVKDNKGKKTLSFGRLDAVAAVRKLLQQ
ncbi:thermitase, putative [Perkinsus marinus ATCC 50983]|uniref:subtilisin n=1 Tax=Perkinsus marinus (strain ATCC 50983 / TXsc) TaxID=423536 RepID=C5LTJ5_PERM5|nr:thermitase, putative [Perkinsus marinus ATCC 50983]EEQ99945.1 thermitase, putative [Perkinsus marinus ATCC 50983]|eukprot:XP_002767228.1 thermitase, putative [Perkinsus marinus ATCC 50983]